MNKRKIKNTDLEIAPINFGGNVFGWTLDEKQSFDILDQFAEYLRLVGKWCWWTIRNNY